MSDPETSSWQYRDASNEYVVVPEYFRPATIETLMPGQIIYPIARKVVVIDESNHGLYINTRKYYLDEEDLNPITSMNGRLPIMYVAAIDHRAIGKNQLVDTYVADMRYINPKEIKRGTIADDGPDSEWRRIGAAEGVNLLGQPDYWGNKSYREYVVQLQAQVDERLAAVSVQDKLYRRMFDAIEPQPRHAQAYQPRHAAHD